MSTFSRRDALRLALGGTAALGTFTLTGCGRNGTGAVAAAASSPVGTAPATGTVNVWAPQGDADVLSTVIKPFKAANPALTVKLTEIPSSDYYTKLQAAIASGSGPDVAQFYPEAQSQFLSASILKPVPDGLVDSSSFFQSVWEAGVVDGVAYTVPWYAYTYALVYRSDLAKKAGMTAPKTWDEMVPFLRGLQSAGAVHGLGADIGWDSYNGQDAAMYAWQAGASLLTSSGTWTLDTPAMVKGMEYNASFFTSGTASTSTPTFLDAQPYFVSGKTAAMITGPWVIGQLDTAAGKAGWTAQNVATAPLPAGPSGSSTTFSAGGTWGVLANSGSADSAWKLIRYLAQPSTQVAQFKAYSSMPAVVSAWENSAIKGQPLLDAFLAQLKNTRAFPQVSTWVQVATRLGAEMEAVAKGTKTAATAAASLQSYAAGLGTKTS